MGDCAFLVLPIVSGFYFFCIALHVSYQMTNFIERLLQRRGRMCNSLRMIKCIFLLRKKLKKTNRLWGRLSEALEGNQDPVEVNYDAWGTEDLVATVQYLATLDDRLQQLQCSVCL